MDRIAIVMMSAIGDAVHVLPVITALKRHAPGCHITWFLAPGPASLMRGHPDVDEIIVFDARAEFGAWRDLRRTLRGRTFDLVLDFQVAIKAGLLAALLDAPVKLGFDRRRARDLNWLFTTHRIPPRENQHVQDQYFEFLEYLGVPTQPVEWKLGPWPHEAGLMSEVFEQAGRPVVAIALASRVAGRNWPLERWVPVVDYLQGPVGLRVVLVGGRSDVEVAGERMLAERCSVAPISTLGSTLREMVAVLAGSSLLITPDTAPQHIAVALGTPVIVLSGLLDPLRTGPYRGSRDLIIDAFRDAGERLPITPDKRPGRMDRITIEDVIAKIDLWRSRA